MCQNCELLKKMAAAAAQGESSEGFTKFHETEDGAFYLVNDPKMMIRLAGTKLLDLLRELRDVALLFEHAEIAHGPGKLSPDLARLNKALAMLAGASAHYVIAATADEAEMAGALKDAVPPHYQALLPQIDAVDDSALKAYTEAETAKARAAREQAETAQQAGGGGWGFTINPN